MAGTRGTNTFLEGLNKVLQDITELKMAPDADLDFTYQLETMVLQQVRKPQDQLAAVQAQQAGQGGMPSAPPPDPSMAGMGAGAGMPMPPDMAMMGSGGGAPGQRMNPQMPSGDEMRRLLGQ